MIECSNGLQSIKRIRAFRILRPKFAIKANPKLWWIYALKCHGFIFRNKIERWQAVKDSIRYIQIYMKLLSNPNVTLSNDDRQFKMDMERLKSLDELYGLRDACYKNYTCQNLQCQNRNISQGKGLLYHWFPNWWGWYGSTTTTNSSNSTSLDNNGNGNGNDGQVGTEIDDDTYKHIEDDILIALKETIESESFSKRDAVFGYFTFTLSDGEVTLNTGGNNNSLALILEFKEFYSFVEVKPRFNSYCIGVSLGSVSLIDKLTKSSEFPYLIRPHLLQTNDNVHTNSSSGNGKFTFLRTNNNDCDVDNEGRKPWFKLRYEKSPIEFQKEHSYRFSIKSESLDVVYNEPTWRWLIAFFLSLIHI